MAFNFKGGIHPDTKKSATHKKPIEEMKPPRVVVLPVIMHKGTPCGPIVDVGERVLIGQKIAESTSPDSCPVHSPVSGTVCAVEPRITVSGEKVLSVVIENDFEDESVPVGETYDRFRSLDAAELSAIARECGIVGLGGSARPLAGKLLDAVDRVDTLIINGTECEPYVTADNRIMVEYSEELHDGAMIIAKAIGAREVVLSIQSDKAHAIAEMRRVFTKKSGIRLSVVHTKYPQGAERQLVSALLGREIPPDGTGADVGVLCINVSTAVALSRAVREGRPLYERVVTVSGSAVANPKNLLVKIGTPIEDLFDACGGFLEHPDRIIAGGPMMGRSQFSLDAPVQKGTNAVLAFCRGEERNEPESVCIRCGKCVDACPMNLMPLYIYRDYKAGDISACEEQNISDCTECGCCSYVCPARISLVSAICAAKQKTLLQGKRRSGDETRQ